LVREFGISRTREGDGELVLVLERGNVSQPGTSHQGLNLRKREEELAKPV